MGQTVKLRRSAVSGKKPTNAQIELGELSVNTTDGKLFFAKSGSRGPSVEEIITTNAQNTGSLEIVGSITGSFFTGSFIGNGGGLHNIPASGVTGLSLDKISSGASSASINSNGLQVNVNTSITGSLTATQFNGSGLGLTNVPISISGSNVDLVQFDTQSIKLHFDDSTGIKVDFIDPASGIARIYLDGVAAEGSGVGSTAKLEVTSATSTWTFNHNLGEKYPSITVFDSNDNVILPQNIEAVSDTQLVVSFSSPQTGYVTATVGGGLPSFSASYNGRVLTINDDGTAPTWKTGIVSGSEQITLTGISGYNDLDNRIDSIETSTGSLNSFTSSIDTTIKNKLNSDRVISGSIQVDITGTTNFNQIDDRFNSLEIESSSIRSDFNIVTSSFDGRLDSLETESGSIRTAFNSHTSSNNTTNTNQNSRLGNLETESGSIRSAFNSHTSSNNTTNTNQNSRLTSLESVTGSYLTSYTETQNLQDVTDLGNVTTNSIEAMSFVMTNGTPTQFLKADGSIDENTYLTAHPSVVAATSSNNGGRTYIQDILLDSFGHITGITTATETVVDTNNFTTGATFNTGDGVVTFTKNDGTIYNVDLDGRYQSTGNYITALTGEVTASGPGSVTATLLNSAVIGKVLTGLNLSGGGTITTTDSILVAFGKTQNQISALVGGVMYEGVWDASTNTPTITSSVGSKGDYYVVNVKGTINIDGITSWEVGDWIIFNGTTWDKVDNTDAVSSVNGFTGAVSLTTAHVAEVTNLYYTEGRVNANTNVAANTAARHNAVTIGTGNGLSLSTQVLSLALASTSTTGALSSTDWNTFNNKQNTITNPVTGTGTTNFLSKFTGGSILGNSQIFDNGTNVGIGTTAPNTKLHVAGIIQVSEGGNTAFYGGNYVRVFDNQNFRIRNVSGTTVANISVSGNSYFNGGNVGIGATAPVSKLQVNHSSAPSFNANGGANALTLVRTGGSGAAGTFGAGLVFSQPYLTDDASIGVGGIYGVKINGSGTFGGGLAFFAQPNSAADMFEVMRITSAGNVGIGTTSPGTKLDVTGGSIQLSTSGSGLYFGTSSAAQIIGVSGASSYLALGTVGSERMRITAGGNLGIGTTSPANTLQIGSVGATGYGGNKLAVGDGTNVVALHTGAVSYLTANGDIVVGAGGNTTNQVYVKSGGNVGIGTTTPAAKLDIVGAGTGLALSFGVTVPNNPLFLNTYGGWSGIGMDVSTAGLRLVGEYQTNNPVVDMGYYTSATVQHANWTSIMMVRQGGNVGIGTTSPNMMFSVKNLAGITNDGQISWGIGTGFMNWDTGYVSISGQSGTALVLGSNGSEKMRITTAGNVGIGTTSPTAKLQVEGDGVVINTENVAGAKFLYFRYSNGGDVRADSFLTFSTGGSPTEKMRITSAGDVGIGTTAPQYKLDVAQAIRSNYGSNEGSLYLGSTPAGVAYVAGAVRATPSPSYSYTGKLSFYTTTWGVGTDYGLTEQMYIDVTGSDTKAATLVMLPWGGNVGIGTTSPAAKLHVVGTESRFGGVASGYVSVYNANSRSGYLQANEGSDFRIASDTNDMTFYVNGSERVRFTAGGNVGIGNTAPAYKLDVDGTGRFISPTAANGAPSAGYFYSGDDSSNMWRAAVSIQHNSNTTIVAGSSIGIVLSPLASTGSTFYGHASIKAVRPNATANNQNTDLSFWTRAGASNSTTDTEKMRITNAGNVGIGTTAPQVKLQIQTATSNDTSVEGLRIYNAGGGVGAGVKIGLGVGTAYSEKGYIRTDIVSGGAGRMFLGVNGGDVITINNSSNVGIGTTAPAGKLHVYGGRIVIDNTLANQSAIQFNHAGTEMAVLYRPNGISNQIRMYTSSGGDVMTWNQSNVGIGTTSPSERLHVQGNISVTKTILSNQENLDVDSGATRVIATIASATYDGAFFDFVIKKGTNLRAGTVYSIHNGTTVEFTEISTNDLGNTNDVTLSVDLSGGNIRLLATTLSNDWIIKILVRGI